MPEKTNVLVVGSGGREHALAWKLGQSPKIGTLYVAPGNGGTSNLNVPIQANDIQSLADYVEKNKCFTIVGPEDPLCLGLVDLFEERGLQAFGPKREQAMLEGSKSYAKQVMESCKIPTAKYRVFEDYTDAVDFCSSLQGAMVVKADGLAKGKGVFVCNSQNEAEDALRSLLVVGSMGKAGRKVVIEQRLDGYEVSVMTLCNGRTAISFGTATDYKRALDGDKGPNTGGMGSCSPALAFTAEQENEVLEKIVKPVVRKTGFRGFLYAGLMISGGEINVLEFNARLGDPETQSIIPRLESDLLGILLDVEYSGIGANFNSLQWSDKTACTVAMCSKGYPATGEVGAIISGVPDASGQQQVLIFHSGTKMEREKLLTNGGRVLSVTAIGENLGNASHRAYETVDKIKWEGEHHRNDIGSKNWVSKSTPLYSEPQLA